MRTLIITIAVLLWFVSRGRLWKKVFNLRRELRGAIRHQSFGRYYVSIRWREIAGLFGFVLITLPGSPAEVLRLDTLLQPIVAVYTLIAIYMLYLLWDVQRLYRRFQRLIG